jgi:DNA-binding NarL/FixJ family response regulator
VLQRTILNLEPGDRIRLKVRRGGKEFGLLADAPRERAENADDCVQPVGQEFALYRAAGIRHRLQDQDATLATLTAREVQVLRMAAGGATNPHIADQLDISRATVARHIANLLAKLGASNRVEAASMAAANQILASR